MSAHTARVDISIAGLDRQNAPFAMASRGRGQIQHLLHLHGGRRLSAAWDGHNTVWICSPINRRKMSSMSRIQGVERSRCSSTWRRLNVNNFRQRRGWPRTGLADHFHFMMQRMDPSCCATQCALAMTDHEQIIEVMGDTRATGRARFHFCDCRGFVRPVCMVQIDDGFNDMDTAASLSGAFLVTPTNGSRSAFHLLRDPPSRLNASGHAAEFTAPSFPIFS